jgi:hypothetical protein
LKQRQRHHGGGDAPAKPSPLATRLNHALSPPLRDRGLNRTAASITST